jgi:hypothetical protein
MINGHLYQPGWYLAHTGQAHRIVGLAQHSETGELFVLDATDAADWRAIPLSTFADRNVNGTGKPAFVALQNRRGDGHVHMIAPGIDPGAYQHFKGQTYAVYGTLSAPDGARLVLYRPHYGQAALMLRPLAMFTERVNKPSIPYNGPRFWRVGSTA